MLPQVLIIYQWVQSKSVSIVSFSPLTTIFNLSITTGAVPNEMKIARVIPLYKSGAHNVFTNYRPVSILPAFSKILEKIMYKRLLAFLDRHKILSDTQLISIRFS